MIFIGNQPLLTTLVLGNILLPIKQLSGWKKKVFLGILGKGFYILVVCLVVISVKLSLYFPVTDPSSSGESSSPLNGRNSPAKRMHESVHY